jgi:2-dehydropantoate 2-reductase
MRFIIYGAGAIGGVIGSRLHQAGNEVVLIARGAHLEAIRRKGLTLEAWEETATLEIPAVGDPAEIEFSDDDVVLLCMKTQDTAAAVERLALAAPPALSVVCGQNGVENERLALRQFANVYGMVVMLPATHLEPGVVIASSSPTTGMLDIGRYPTGVDETARRIAEVLNQATFSSIAQERVMRWKYSKLLMNLGNAVQAACGPDADTADIYRQLREEALACYAAAGIDCATAEETRERRTGGLELRPVGGQMRHGGSTWQSLSRGTGSVESDYLNGEISLLGRLHGVPTPANSTVQGIARRLAVEGRPPGSISAEELREEIGRAEAARLGEQGVRSS